MNTDNIKSHVWKAGALALATASLLFIALFLVQAKDLFGIGSHSANPQNAPQATFTVEGNGDVVVKPDVATFSFGVTETAKTVKDAQDAASTRSNAARDAILAAGVEDKDIKTTSYNISPHYEYQQGACKLGGECLPGKSVITGYDVSESFQVKVRDLSKAGALFQTVGGLGVQNVDSLQFGLDDPQSAQEQARSLAIADARKSAEKLASELGVGLGRIVSFSDGASSPAYPVMYDRAMSASAGLAKAPAPEIAAGEQKISDTVQVTYEIR